jgi:hypothetical protein
MPTREQKSMYAAIILLAFAVLACAPETARFTRYHDFSESLSNWKYVVNGQVEQTTQFHYNEDGDIATIEFYYQGKPDFITTYLDYITVRDSSGSAIKYRICKRRIGYSKAGVKTWEDSTSVVVINGIPKLKSLVTLKADGTLRYKDDYEYDEQGRKITATRTITSTNKKIEHKYNYDDGKNLGVAPIEYFFETPKVFYNQKQSINWITLAEKAIQIQ